MTVLFFFFPVMIGLLYMAYPNGPSDCAMTTSFYNAILLPLLEGNNPLA